MKEANLLDSIGSAHMEQEIQKKVPFKFATILACCLSDLYPPSPPPPPTSPPLPVPLLPPPLSPPPLPAPLSPPAPLPDDSGEGGFSDDGDCSVGVADSDGLGLLSDCDDGGACWSDGKSD